MKVLRAYRVELDPNNEQRTAMAAHCGAARWVHNWALNKKIDAYKEKSGLPSAISLAKELRAQRKDVAPWLTEYSSYVIDSNLKHVDWAFERYFEDLKSGRVERVETARKKKKKQRRYTEQQVDCLQHLACFPQFHSKSEGIGSCSFHKQYKIENGRAYLPRIGWIRLKEKRYIPLPGTQGVKLGTATISEKGGHWFLSVQVTCEVPDPVNDAIKPVAGVDVGIHTLATVSTETTYPNPKALKRSLRKLRRVQRALSRKQQAAKKTGRKLEDCKNFQKNKRQLAKIHARVANIRSNNLHVVSHRITQAKRAVVIEDLNIQGMAKNKRLAQAIYDCGLGELRRRITYKSGWRGVDLLVADRWFASSKLCSVCGWKKDDLRLRDRAWTCVCGAKHDRDLNAAFNLRNLYFQSINNPDVAGAASDTLNARGRGNSGRKSSDSQPVAPVESRTRICESHPSLEGCNSDTRS